MANVFEAGAELAVTIPEIRSQDNVTYYQIRVGIAVQAVHWTVERRYRDFADLHATLLEAGVQGDSLPQKRYLGNQDTQFVMQRRKQLEAYLQSVVCFLQHSIPESLAQFLALDRYDLNYLLRNMAGEHFDRLAVEQADPWLFEAIWTPLEVFAIAQRLKSPLPPQDPTSRRYDFAHVADRACTMRALKLNGMASALGSSNVVPNALSYDLLAFKSLTKLILNEIVCGPESITALGSVRHTLSHLSVNRSDITSVAHLLLADTPHHADQADDSLSRAVAEHPSYAWPQLRLLDLRYNQVARIDASIRLAPKLTSLFLGSNRVRVIENLTCLPELAHLELADNQIEAAPELHVKLGQVNRIDLSHNRIQSLTGVLKLYSLRHLNMANNRIQLLRDVFPVSQLPCLEDLNLQGNPVTSVVDYRIKLFEAFGQRCPDLCLDNEHPSQSEIDKVSILMALRVAKEGRPPTSLFGNLPKRTG